MNVILKVLVSPVNYNLLIFFDIHNGKARKRGYLSVHCSQIRKQILTVVLNQFAFIFVNCSYHAAEAFYT